MRFFRLEPRSWGRLGLLAALGLALLSPHRLRQRLEGPSSGPKAPLVQQLPVRTEAASPAEKQEVAAILENGAAAEIHALLFTPGRIERDRRAPLLPLLQKRFARSYELEGVLAGSAMRAEIVARLGMLKGLGGEARDAGVQAFLRRIAGNPREHWLVQRQALRELQPWLAAAGDAERSLLLGEADPRAVALAGQSDRELLGEIAAGAGERGPAAADRETSWNSYANIFCPTQEEFDQLAAEVHWEKTSAVFLCDASPEGKLGKLLLLFKRMDLTGAKTNLRGPVAENLRRPWLYFTRRVHRLALDLSQSTTAAYNSQGDIHLGAAFFRQSPLDAMETLVHEARHTDAEDPGHVTCVQGDIPGVAGGCDNALSGGARAGGYSYGTFFWQMLASTPGIPAADREYLRSQALTSVAQRFNRLPPQMAQFTDGILGLDSNSQLVFLHPFARYSYPLSTLLPKEEVVTSLAHDDRSGGVLLFTNRLNASVWNWGRGFSAYFPELIENLGLKVRFAAKLAIPVGRESFTYSAFLDGDDRGHVVRLDSGTGEFTLEGLPSFLDTSQAVSFCMTLSDGNYFLSANKRLFRFGAAMFDDYVRSVGWADGQEWTQLDCGVLHDSVHAISSGGELFRQQIGMLMAAGDPARPVNFPTTGRRSDLQSPAGAVVYHEGTQLRALLDRDGVLRLRPHSDPQREIRLRPFGRKVKDFAFFHLLLARDFGTPQDPRGSGLFSRRCGVRSPQLDPWLSKWMGIDLQDRLVFEGMSGDCVPAALPLRWQGRVAEFAFESLPYQERNVPPMNDAKRPYFFSPVQLKIKTTDGNAHVLRPYEGWDAGPGL